MTGAQMDVARNSGESFLVETLICQDKPVRGADGKLWDAKHPVGLVVHMRDGKSFYSTDGENWEEL